MNISQLCDPQLAGSSERLSCSGREQTYLYLEVVDHHLGSMSHVDGGGRFDCRQPTAALLSDSVTAGHVKHMRLPLSKRYVPLQLELHPLSGAS